MGGEYGTALSASAAAAIRGQMATVSLLLGRRANINTVGGEYETLLAAVAAIGGQQATVVYTNVWLTLYPSC